jgi:hypothetical protein
MPAVVGLRATTPSILTSSVTHPETDLLYLPSQMPLGNSVLDSLADKERWLRVAQADDALAELKRLLRITMGLWEYKYTQIGSGQGANTYTRTMITHFKTKVTHCADRYRAARAALLKLDPTGDWIIRLCELKAEDIRAPGREEGESEGRRELSWNWLVQHDKTGEEPESDRRQVKRRYMMVSVVCLSCFRKFDF